MFLFYLFIQKICSFITQDTLISSQHGFSIILIIEMKNKQKWFLLNRKKINEMKIIQHTYNTYDRHRHREEGFKGYAGQGLFVFISVMRFLFVSYSGILLGFLHFNCSTLPIKLPLWILRRDTMLLRNLPSIKLKGSLCSPVVNVFSGSRQYKIKTTTFRWVSTRALFRGILLTSYTVLYLFMCFSFWWLLSSSIKGTHKEVKTFKMKII